MILALIKSCGDPLIDIAGAYFPAWLACMLLGIVGTWIAYFIFCWLKIPEVMKPPVLMIPAVFSVITLWSWFFYFAAR